MHLWPWWLYNTWLPATALAKDIGVCWILIEANRVVRSKVWGYAAARHQPRNIGSISVNLLTQQLPCGLFFP